MVPLDKDGMHVQVKASLIVVLTRGGSTARLVAKYKPSIPVLTVAVPVLTTDSLTWTCSGEQPARQCLITRGLLPLLAEGSARATDTDTTDEIISVSLFFSAPHNGLYVGRLHALLTRPMLEADGHICVRPSAIIELPFDPGITCKPQASRHCFQAAW